MPDFKMVEELADSICNSIIEKLEGRKMSIITILALLQVVSCRIIEAIAIEADIDPRSLVDDFSMVVKRYKTTKELEEEEEDFNSNYIN